MTPSPPAAGRLPVLACGLLALLALALPGCGEEGAAAPESAAARQQAKGQKQIRTATAAGCPRQLEAFVAELRVLRHQLAVGISYDQYLAAVEDLRAGYDAIPVDRLTLDCLADGTASERALNKHVDAANAWGECLADAACTTTAIEPVLQREWRAASRYLSEAR